jgi:hypothetical protein
LFGPTFGSTTGEKTQGKTGQGGSAANFFPRTAAGGNGQGKTGQGVSAAGFLPQGHQYEKEAAARGVSTRERQIDKEAGAHDVRGSGADSDEDSYDDMAEASSEWVVNKRRKLSDTCTELNCLQENIVGGGSSSSSSSNKNENGKSANSHHLMATFFGVVLTKCETKVNKRGNPLLAPSQSVIKNHWLENKKCISGNPDSEKASKSLNAELIDIRLKAYQEPATLAKVAEEHFPVNSEERNAFICGKCVFHAYSWQNFIKHFGKKNKQGCIQSCTPIYCTMVKGKYGTSIPKEMLNRIKHLCKITEKGECDLQFKPSNLPEEIEHLYRIIGRESNDLTSRQHA